MKKKCFRTSRDGSGETEYFEETYYPTIEILGLAYLQKAQMSSSSTTIWDLIDAVKNAQASFNDTILTLEFKELVGYREEIKKNVISIPEPDMIKKKPGRPKKLVKK